MLISGRLAAERAPYRIQLVCAMLHKLVKQNKPLKLRESQLSEGLSVKTGTVTQYLFCQELNKTERLRYTRKHRNGVPVGTHFLLDKGTPLNPFGENRSDELTGRTAATNHERSTRKRTPNEVRENTTKRRGSGEESTGGEVPSELERWTSHRHCSKICSQQ